MASSAKTQVKEGVATKVRRWLRRLFVAGIVATALGIAAGAIGFKSLESRLPDVFSFAAYQDLAVENSRVYASGGELIARFGGQLRTVVPMERIPATVRFAVVCAEDAAFYHHPGLDLLGIARALWVDISQGRYAQGASTITQQFAKTRFLSSEKKLVRKLKELVLARKLEQKVSKDDILAMYMNEIYFGDGRYGVEAASRYFFGKPVSEVNVAEAALLAGVVNSPARFSPYRHPKRALGRRRYVLRQMERRGYISAADMKRADAQPLPKKGHEERVIRAPWVVAAVRRQATARVGRQALRNEGLRIEVAMDITAQRAAEAAVTTGLHQLDLRYKTRNPVRKLSGAASMARAGARLKKRRKGRRAPMGRPITGVVRSFDPDLGTYSIDLGGERGTLHRSTLRRFHGEDGKPPSFRRGDVIRVSIRARTPKETLLSPELGPQAALVAIDPKTRLIRALVGGDDPALHPFHRAIMARRQPGSTFKTFVYGAAIEAGMATPDTRVTDEKRTYRSHGRPWTPRNYTGRWDAKPHSLRDALARSINSIAVEMARRVGPDAVADFAKRCGIASTLRPDLPLALGASGVTPIELANAYATIAANGMFAEPILITRIIDRRGKERFRAKTELTRVIPANVAHALSDMLGEVVRRGSARKAKVGRPVAGKTGTTNRARDAWFVGFSPRLAAAVWVGWDDRKPMPKGSGGKLALPIWADFMRAALDRVPVAPLPRLPHVLGTPRAPPIPLDEDPEEGAASLVDELAEQVEAGLLLDLP
ncbi:MAG: PBP1A family penicillin-binding protein [Myxococcales bacterium]|nr:PBP1A family penicillin-binding protein [Myxococcales bacterium]